MWKERSMDSMYEERPVQTFISKKTPCGVHNHSHDILDAYLSSLKIENYKKFLELFIFERIIFFSFHDYDKLMF